MTDLLNSRYIIDGVPQDLTPAQVLSAVSESPGSPATAAATIVDETVDPSIEAHDWNPRRVQEYLDAVGKTRWRFPLPFADVATLCKLSISLIDAIWRKGSFRMEDLAVKAAWKWNPDPVGAQAAFYESVQAASDFIDGLGLKMSSYTCGQTTGSSDVAFRAVISQIADDDDEFGSGIPRPRMSTQPACPSTIMPDPQSWLIYIPFDTSDYRLGGSLLAQSQNLGGGVSLQLPDYDYFMDCYEVVRELVEDGILLSAVTVGRGGLLAAANKLCLGGPGATLDISGISHAFEEPNIVRILFSEVPGALVQIRDIDFDYVDAELLLQDVAYFPLGHPNLKSGAVRVRSSAKTGIQTILESLMQNAEGED